MLKDWASKDPKGYPNCIARIKTSICKYTNQQLIDMDTDSQNWKDWVDEVLLYITLNTASCRADGRPRRSAEPPRRHRSAAVAPPRRRRRDAPRPREAAVPKQERRRCQTAREAAMPNCRS